MANAPTRGADFSVSPEPAVRNSPTTFTSIGCAATPCTYRWFHGDAASTQQFGTGATASFTYTEAPGTRTVTLKVTDRRNREATRTRSFQLVEPSSPSPASQCSDGRDNDGDGATDYPADVGCSSATDNDESNIVVSPPASFPDASTTGVPVGTTLTSSGSMTISTAGAIVDARHVTGSITVNASNVTIRRTRVDSDAFRAIASNSTGLVIEDSEIVDTDGGTMCHNAVGYGGFTMRRVEVSGCENAADVGNGTVLIEDSYFHDLAAPGTGTSQHPDGSPHTDGVQGVDLNVRIRRNWIDPVPASGCTSPIIFNVNATGRDVWVEDNYLDGRGCSYALYANRQASTNVNINRNRMLKGYGYTACVRLGVTVTEFAGNVDHLTGALLSPDNGIGGGCTN